MDFDELTRRLTSRLAEPLPGLPSQLAMAPRPRVGWDPGRIPPGCRHSGVLLLIFPSTAGEAVLVLTVRPAHMKNHAGQVAFPGGAVEPGESYEDAALREAEEEIGLDRSRVRILGGLTPLHVPVSGFVVHPRIGMVPSRPRLAATEHEVARILEVPVERLLDPVTRGVERRETSSVSLEIPYFAIEGERVWGATAMVVSELLALLETGPDSRRAAGR